MQKTVFRRFLLIVLATISLQASADFQDAPAPVQSFEQALSVKSTTDSKSSASSTVASASVKTNAQQPMQALNKSASRIPAQSSPDHGSVAVLQALVAQINQNDVLYQQKTDALIQDLTSKNQLMQQQLEQLTQALSLLNQEVNQLKTAKDSVINPTPAVSAPSTGFKHWVESFGFRFSPQSYALGVTAIALILLLLIWIFWPRSNMAKSMPDFQNSLVGEDDTKSEYDYMGSNESMPAKLNLARTYIAMEDYVAARSVLHEVSEKGDEQQQQEASDLLKAFPSGNA